MRLRKVTVFLVAFWVIGALAATDASAQFRLRIEDLNSITPDGHINAVVITDNGAGDEVPVTGAMSFTLFASGGVDVSGTVSYSKPIVTGPSNALQSLFLNSLTMTSSGAANIRLTLEDTSYNNGVGNFDLTSRVIDGAFIGNGTVTIQSWVNTSNIAPNLGPDSANPTVMTSMDVLGPNVGNGTIPAQVLSPSPDFTGTPDGTVSFNATGDYALWTQVAFNLTGASSINFDQDAFVTPGNGEAQPPDGSPEPTSLMLISSGLMGLAGSRRRQILAMFGRG